MIKPCSISITNEKEPVNFASPSPIEYQIYFFKEENGVPVIIFNFKKRSDNKAFIFARNSKNYQIQKVFVQNSCYRISTLLNFHGFLLNTNYEDAFDFFNQFRKISQLNIYEEGNG
jgi:hypothetical protein